MDSKERVLITMSHEEADRVPINFRATDYIIENLSKTLKLDYFEILKYFQVDFREIMPSYVGPKFLAMKDGSKIDIWGVRRKEYMTERGKDVLITLSPLKFVKSTKEIIRHKWPKVEWFDFSQVKKNCNFFKGFAISTPGIHCEGYHGVLHLLTYLFGMEEAMMNLALRPDLIITAKNEIMKFLYRYYEIFLESAGGMIDFLFYKDDFGAQNSLLISPEMFLDFFYPDIKALCQLAANYGAKFIMHSCGSVVKIIPNLIQAGISVLDPIQITAKNMDIHYLKERFGEQLTFHGGIDVQRLMPQGTIEEIHTTVRKTLEVLGKDGGYFFSPSHRFQSDTPLENILALYKFALKYGHYH